MMHVKTMREEIAKGHAVDRARGQALKDKLKLLGEKIMVISGGYKVTYRDICVRLDESPHSSRVILTTNNDQSDITNRPIELCDMSETELLRVVDYAEQILIQASTDACARQAKAKRFQEASEKLDKLLHAPLETKGDVKGIACGMINDEGGDEHEH